MAREIIKYPENIVYTDVRHNIGLINGEEILTNEQAVLNSILNILGTVKGERVFRPLWGSTIKDYLSDPNDEKTWFGIKMALIFAMKKHEPRVSLNKRLSKVVKGDVAAAIARIVTKIEGLEDDLDQTLQLKTMRSYKQNQLRR